MNHFAILPARFPRRSFRWTVLASWCGLLLNALASDPGTVAWSAEHPGHRWGTPAVGPDGTIYSVLTPPAPGRDVLVALRADGTERWRLGLADRDHQPPIVGESGQVFLTRGNGMVRAVDADGLPLWQLALRLDGASGAALAVDGTLHLGGVDPSRGTTYVVIAPDGSILQRGPLAEAPDTHLTPVPGMPPQVGGDGMVVYLSTGVSSGAAGTGAVSNAMALFARDSIGAPALGPADTFAVPSRSGLSLRHADGQEHTLWDRAEVTSSPVLRPDGILCFGSASSRLHAINAAGVELWSVDAGAPIRSTPVVLDGGIVVAATVAGRLFAVNDSGGLIWERTLSEPVSAHLSILGDGTVLVADEGGTLWGIVTGATPAAGGWPKWQADPSNRGRNPSPPVVLQAPSQPAATDEASVQIAWESVSGARRYEVLRDTVPAGSSATRIASTPFNSWNDTQIEPDARYRYWIRAVRGSESGPESLPVEIRAQRFLWRTSIGEGIRGLAMLSDGSLVAVASSGVRSEVVTLDRNGTERWRRPLPTGVLNPPLVSEQDQIWIHTRTGLAQFTAEGIPGVFVPTLPDPGEDRPGPMALGQQGVLYAPVLGANKARLIALDSTTGRLRGDSPMEDPGGWVLSVLTGHDGAVLLIGASRVICHEPGTQRRWSRRMEAFGAAVLTDGDYVVGYSMGLVRISPWGQPKWTNSFFSADPGAFGMPGMVVDHRNVTYLRFRGGLRAVSAEGALLWDRPESTIGPSPKEFFLDALGGVSLASAHQVFRLDNTGIQVSRLSSMLHPLGSAPFALLDPRGHLFLGSDSGAISALDLGIGVATNAPWPLARHDVGNRASSPKRAVEAPAVVTAEASPWVGGNRVRWTPSGALVDHAVYRSEFPDFSLAIPIGQALASDGHFDDRTAVPGTTYFYWVVASNVAGNSPAAAPASTAGMAPTVRARVLLPMDASAPPPVPVVRPDGSVVAGDGVGTSLAMDLDGHLLWTNRISKASVSQVFQMLSDATGQIVLGTANGLFRIAPNGSSSTRLAANPGVISLGPDGLLRHRVGQSLTLRNPTGETVGSPVPSSGFDLAGFVRSDGLAISLNPSGVLRALDGTWNTIWEAMPGTGATSAVLALGLDGTIFLAPDPQSLVALDAFGGLMWRQSLGMDTRSVLGATLGPLDKTLSVLSEDRNGTLILSTLDPASGLELWRFSGSTPAAPFAVPGPPATTDDHTVLLTDGHLLWALDGITGVLRWGFEGSGQLGPPVIHSDGSIIFTSGDEVIVLRGFSPPAFSGWPMAGHDARGSRSQGSLGVRDLNIAPMDGGASGVSLRAAGGGAFIPLVSEDLHRWRPAQGSFHIPPASLQVPGPSHSPRLDGTHQFFRGVSP
ncbi:MAG: PQQ-binding-like beta-propeller repeat protein [Verrucomicrobiae bacterium]|nr:PQQ-binding-like beta-propeller repeat protein [Verrucomicrobiae bacterium]